MCFGARSKATPIGHAPQHTINQINKNAESFSLETISKVNLNIKILSLLKNTLNTIAVKPKRIITSRYLLNKPQIKKPINISYQSTKKSQKESKQSKNNPEIKIQSIKQSQPKIEIFIQKHFKDVKGEVIQQILEKCNNNDKKQSRLQKLILHYKQEQQTRYLILSHSKTITIPRSILQRMKIIRCLLNCLNRVKLKYF